MKKSKRILAALLCAVMMAVLVPTLSVSAAAYSGTCGDDLTWKLDIDTGILTIRGTGDMTNYSKYSDVPWYNYRTSVTLIVILDGVTSIGNCAFYGCSKMTSITISEGVTSIGNYAFCGCSSLTDIIIPKGVANIGNRAFYRCSKMISITIPEGVTSIGNYAFYECMGLTSVAIPNGVTSIGNYTFYECSKLTDITIPASVTSIEDEAFAFCDQLTDVYYGGTLVEWNAVVIGDDNTALTSATIHCTYDKIYSGTCGDNLTWELNSETGVLTISGTGAMTNYDVSDAPWYDYGETITSVIIDEGVTSIGNWAFSYCGNLIDVSIPKSVTAIGDYAFYVCSNMASITIPVGVTSIGKYAFAFCGSLTNITMSKSVTNIGRYAFYDCSGLSDVYYTGSEAEWDVISVESNNTCLTDAAVYYNYAAILKEVLLSGLGSYEDVAEADIIITEDGGVTVNVTITDESVLSAEHVTAYAASYADGAVENVDKLEKTVTDDGATFSGSVSGSYKIFIWDENMQPITEAAE